MTAAVVEAPGARVRRAAAAFAASRDAATALELRAALFALAGVPAGATLADALRTGAAQAADLRRALLAAEAAAFGPSGERERAGDDVLAAADTLTGAAR